MGHMVITLTRTLVVVVVVVGLADEMIFNGVACFSSPPTMERRSRERWG